MVEIDGLSPVSQLLQLNRQTLDSRQVSKHFYQLSKSSLSITNSSDWLCLVNRCKYSVSQLYSFSSSERRLGNLSWGTGQRVPDDSRVTSQKGALLCHCQATSPEHQLPKHYSPKRGALILFPHPPASIQRQFFAWMPLHHDLDWQLQGLNSGPLCTLTPWSVELQNLFFLPWVYPVFHKTLVSHCGTQPFFQSGLSKENKTKH